MSGKLINYEKKDGVAIVTLNNPKNLNSLDDALIAQFKEVINDVQTDDKIGAVILTGTGRAFCAGGDINVMADGFTVVSGYKHMTAFHKWTSEFAKIKKPIIGAINGLAVGGGFSLALLCDVLLASTDAKFSLAFVNVALVPDLGIAHYLARSLGKHKLKELSFTGRMIGVEEAVQLGFVMKAVQPQKLMEEAFELAKQLADGPRVMLSYTKKLIDDAYDLDHDTVLEIEARTQTECFLTQDHKNAARAFFNKEKAVFTGE